MMKTILSLSLLIGLAASQAFAQSNNCIQITNRTSDTVYAKCRASGGGASVNSEGGRFYCCADNHAPETLRWAFTNTHSTTWETLSLSCTITSGQNLTENVDITGSASNWATGSSSCAYTDRGGF